MARPTAFSSLILNGYSLAITGGIIYVNGTPISGGGGGGSVTGIPADVVRTTGSQTIVGDKTFQGVSTFQGPAAPYATLTVEPADNFLYMRAANGQVIFNTEDYAISDVSGKASIWWNDRRLMATNGSMATVDWGNRQTYNTTGGKTSDWNRGATYDNTGRLSVDSSGRVLWSDADIWTVDYNNGKLFRRNSTQSIDWQNSQLKTGPTTPTLDWSARMLSGANWSVSHAPTATGHVANKGYVDTQIALVSGAGGSVANVVYITGTQTISGNKTLQGNGTNAIVVADRQLLNSAGGATVDWASYALINAAGSTAVDWSSNQLLASSSASSLDWENRIAYAAGSSQSIQWGNRTLINGSTQSVLDWNSSALLATDGITQNVNWQSLQLTGNWQNNTVPTVSGHLVNKGYLDTRIAAISGGGGVTGIPSDVVRTTGTQAIFGVKSFELGLTAPNINTNNITHSGHDAAIVMSVQSIYDDSANISIGWGARALYDNAPQLSLQWGDRTLNDTNGNIVLNWDVKNIYDGAGNLSIDWVNRYLYNESAEVTLDWFNRQLKFGGDMVLDWANGVLATDGGSYTLDWANRKLYQSWTTSSQFSFWKDDETYAYALFNATDGLIYFKGVDNNYVFNTESMTLEASGVKTLHWAERILTGQWKTNTLPATSGDIVNKGYFDAQTGNFIAHANYRIITGTLGSVTGTDKGNGIITVNGAITLVAVPSGLALPFSTQIIQGGTGQAIISGSAGVTISSYGTLTGIAGQFGTAALIATGSNAYILVGALS